MSLGYFFVGLSTTYPMVFASLLFMAVGAGFFKPIISGTIARETTAENSSLGFGIFYWIINLGAFLFPLFLVPILKSYSYTYIFFAAALLTGSLLFVNLFVYKEPEKPQTTKSLLKVFTEIVLVIRDWRFLMMLFIYSGFWICYFQLFDSMVWYVQKKMDMGLVNQFVNSILAKFIKNPSWHFDAEHVMVITAGTIIILQLLVSFILKKTKPLPTMITGILIGAFGLSLLGFSNNAWVFIAGLVIFSIGEMSAHPKFIAYIGEIAPADKKALYIGYSFLYGVIGSGVGGILGAFLYVNIIEKADNAPLFWFIFAGIAVATALGLYIYDKVVRKYTAPIKKS